MREDLWDDYIMKFSSKNRIFNRPSKINDELPLIGQLSFDELEKHLESIEITPITCSNCGAVLLDVNDIKDDPKLGLQFTCTFCGTVNKVGSLPTQYVGGTELEFILEKVESQQESKERPMKQISGDLVTSIIDVSGSMSGGKIEAVKHNLVETIKDMGINAPSSAFVMITFESVVQIFLSPNESAISVTEDKILRNPDKLQNFINKKMKQFDIQSIKENVKEWVNQVKNLTSLSMTALGPGLAAGIYIFLTKGIGGRILLLTDGLANVGFGRLEGNGVRESRPLYEKFANICLDSGIVVDVIGVGGGNELALDVLGKLSELTGGELFFVSRDELDETFGELTARQFAGRDVKIKVFTPQQVEIEEITGISSSAKKAKRMETIQVGSVTPEREALFQFKVKDKLDNEVPVQVQVEYKDKEGNKKLRVFKSNLASETSEEEYKKDYDGRLLSMLKIQQAGEKYGMGDVQEARDMLSSTKAMFSQSKGDFSGDVANESIEFLDDELEKIENFELQKKSKAAKSYSAMMGQKRMRMSYDSKLQELKKKKQK